MHGMDPSVAARVGGELVTVAGPTLTHSSASSGAAGHGSCEYPGSCPAAHGDQICQSDSLLSSALTSHDEATAGRVDQAQEPSNLFTEPTADGTGCGPPDLTQLSIMRT